MYAYISLNPISSLVAVLVVGYLVLSYVRSVIDWRTRQRGKPLPPGPTPLPVIGNMLDMPETKKWLGFQDLFAKYGANVNPPYHLLALSDAQRREYRVHERSGKSHRRNRRCRSGPGTAGEAVRQYVRSAYERGDSSVSHVPSRFLTRLTLRSIGNEVSFSVMPYGQWWREHRRAFWQVFHPGAMRGYRDTERAFAHDFLRKLLTSPEDIEKHSR